jgi:hypothetical protein
MPEKLKCAVETCKEPAYTGNALALPSSIGTLVVYVCQRHFAEYCQHNREKQNKDEKTIAQIVASKKELSRFTLAHAIKNGLFPARACECGHTYYVNVEAPEYKAWFEAHPQQSRVRKGMKKERVSKKSQNS